MKPYAQKGERVQYGTAKRSAREKDERRAARHGARQQVKRSLERQEE